MKKCIHVCKGGRTKKVVIICKQINVSSVYYRDVCDGHGTHVTGIIAASGDDQVSTYTYLHIFYVKIFISL